MELGQKIHKNIMGNLKNDSIFNSFAPLGNLIDHTATCFSDVLRSFIRFLNDQTYGVFNWIDWTRWISKPWN
jgi:hypothetical protein